MVSLEEKKQFDKDGFLVMENFLTKEECAALKSEYREIVDKMDPKDHTKCTFDTTKNAQSRNDYFLTSGDKIRFFFEKDALDEEGNLTVNKHDSINKIGHALHVLDPTFKKITFAKKVQDIARDLNFVKPIIVQSMYICKPPHFGGEVTAHQDGIFLYTEPLKLTGLWIALEDALIDNGCLYFSPGSQSREITTRMMRDPDGSGVIFKGDPYPLQVPDDDFIPVPVKAGSLIVIHGQVVHKSSKNTSDRSRHIYTFHIAESEKTEWSSQNWLLPTPEMPFPELFTTE